MSKKFNWKWDFLNVILWIVTGGGKKMGREILFWAIKDQVVYRRLIELIKKEIVSKKVIFQSIENQLTIKVLLKIVNNVNYVYLDMKNILEWNILDEKRILEKIKKKIQ